MQSSIRQSIARIEVMQQGRSLSRGTGCLVAEGLVLTALHVIADRTKDSLALYPGEIVLTFPNHSTKAFVHEAYFDRSADWALLRCEVTLSIHPSPLAELHKDGTPWETYGFPDANPRDGMAISGDVANCNGTLDGNPVFQLFSREAAAGQGAPVKGLSGSPVIVENAVVGVLRFALMKDQQTVAGTVYSCPISSVLEKAGALLPMPDPCFGLPGLPHQPLPAEPFRYLAWFTAKEAEVFFGRNREIRLMYERLTAEDAPPVMLHYGQSGVGKSSFLDAGLVPRLRWYNEVQYLRRETSSSLLHTLLKTLQQAGGRDGNLADWKAIEQKTGKPLIVLFDQIEEIYTRQNENAPEELQELLVGIKNLFDGRQSPRGRLVLSFRKEWFPEIQKQIELQALTYGKVFLEGLDREAIIEVVTGLTRTERLRQFYGLKIEDKLPEVIAGDLIADHDSPIAPTLQILLTKMWKNAASANRSAPELTISLYHTLKQEGLLLGDFLDQQLDELKSRHSQWVESGLALDVLAFHTTPLLTAKQRSREEVTETYSHCSADIPGLLQEMQALFLLSDASADNDQKSTRLSHDTLAPVVRHRFEKSENPGQKARRILESRVEDWAEGTETGLLDDGALAAVRSGIAGMRRLTQPEQKLIEASQVQQRKRHRNLRILKFAATAAVLLIVVASFVAGYQRNRAITEQKESDLELTILDSPRFVDAQPGKALMLAIAAVGRSRERYGSVLPNAQANLSHIIELAREENVWTTNAHSKTVAVLPDGTIATDIELWDHKGKRIPSPFDQMPLDTSCCSVVFSPDGKLLAVSGPDGQIRLFDRNGKPVGAAFGDVSLSGGVAFPSVAFTPDGSRIITNVRNGILTAWDLEGNQIWKAGEKVAFNTAPLWSNDLKSKLAVLSTPKNQVFIVAVEPGGVGVWDGDGKRIEHLTFSQPIMSVAAALDPNGKLIVASGGSGGLVAFWQASGDVIPSIRYQNAVLDLSFSSLRNLLALALADGTVHFVNMAGVEVGQPFRGSASEKFDALAFDPTGTSVVVRSTDKLHIVDTQPDYLLDTLEAQGRLYDVQYSPRGDWIAAAGAVGSGADLPARHAIYLWKLPLDKSGVQTQLPREIGRLEEQVDPDNYEDNSPAALAFDSTGARLASADSNGVLRLWSTQGDLLAEFRGEKPQLFAKGGIELRFSSDDKGLISATSADVTLWDLGTKEVRSLLPMKTPGPWFTAAVSPDGKRFATTWVNDTTQWMSKDIVSDAVRIWDLEKRPIGSPLPLSGITGLQFSADGKWIILFNHDGFRLLHLDGDQGFSKSASIDLTSRFETSENAFFAAMHPSGETVFTLGSAVSVWSVSNWQHLAEFPAGTSNSVTVSPDGKVVAGAGSDGVVRLWRATWKEWLEVACRRLRNHPILNDPLIVKGPDQENLHYARDICQELVWQAKRQ